MSNHEDIDYVTFKPFYALGLGILVSAIFLLVAGNHMNRTVRGSIFTVSGPLAIAIHYWQVRKGQPRPKRSDALKSSVEILEERKEG